MINPAAQDLEVWAGLRFGVPVERAAATLPQTVAAAIFNIIGGRVAILSIIGEVTTVIQTQANATKLVHNPTDAGVSQDLCATVDITADAVGTMYSITGTPATALQDGLNFLSPNKTLPSPLILKAGVIELNCAGSNTGAVKWQVRYLPIDEGAYVEVA